MDEDLVSITGGPLRAHEYVLVVPELLAGDEAWIQNHSAKISGDTKNPQVTLTIGDVQLATLKRVIKGWNLTKPTKQPDGSVMEVPFPFSTKDIERLPSRIYKYVLRKFNEMNPDEEENEEDFLPVVVDSSEDNFQAERVVRLKR